MSDKDNCTLRTVALRAYEQVVHLNRAEIETVLSLMGEMVEWQYPTPQPIPTVRPITIDGDVVPLRPICSAAKP